MEQTFWIALGASSLAALVTALGIYAVRRFEGWARAQIVYFISYAAGVLIAASFLHLVPESFEMNPHAAALLLAGFAGMHFFHRFLCAFVCERHHVIQPGIGIMPVLGIGFHSFIDGMVYAVTYQVSVFTGTLAAVGMVLHEFPEGIVTYLLLIHGGFRPRAALWTALAAMAMAPLGAHLTQSVPKDVLIGLFAVLTALAGFFSLRGAGREETPAPMSPRRRMAIGLALGGGEGFIGALLGVGGGFIVAPVLMMLGFGAKQAAGTTAFIVTFASVSGFAAHAAEGHIEPLLAVLTVIAALAGSQLGAWFMAKRAKPGWVKRLYGVLLLGVAAKLIFDIVRG